MNVSTDRLKLRPMPDTNAGIYVTPLLNLLSITGYAHKFAMFDVTSFPAMLSGIGRHFKFCRYVNCNGRAGIVTAGCEMLHRVLATRSM